MFTVKNVKNVLNTAGANPKKRKSIMKNIQKKIERDLENSMKKELSQAESKIKAEIEIQKEKVIAKVEKEVAGFTSKYKKEINMAEKILETKKPWQSKTVWMNLIVAVAAFFPTAQEWIASNPEAFAGIITVLNMGLRLASKDKVSLKGE